MRCSRPHKQALSVCLSSFCFAFMWQFRCCSLLIRKMHAVWTAEYAAKRPNRDALEKRINAIMDAFDKESAEVRLCISVSLF